MWGMAFDWTLNEIILFLLVHPKILSFAAGLVAEEVLLILAIFSGKGFITSPWTIAVFGYLGVMVIDTVYFFIGRTKFIGGLREHRLLSRSYRKLPKFMTELKHKNEFLFLFSTKFIYGVRTFGIISLGHKGTTFGKFLKYNTLAVAIWFAIMLPLGWLAGQGLGDFFSIAQHVDRLLLVAVIIVIVYYVVIKSVFRYLLKR